MSSDPTPAARPFLVRFWDGFLQEHNIKWVLCVGMLILLGSSLLLVSAHWEESTPLWKYLILLGYTVAIFGVGEWTRHRLVLPRTATVLQALTVLLLPITFLVLSWVQDREDPGLVGQGLHLLLAAANLGIGVIASRKIFQYFLRGHQPTFLTCYLLLCLAGAVVPGLPAAWSPIVALALWAVFAAGSIKVNRHVFWLIEENRAPRIFGFFPVALLGGQFLSLFLLHAPQTIAIEWFGLGGVLVAMPILLTADAVARVFQQRTGNLVRPLPWSIIGPLVLGLALCLGGVVLSAASLVPPSRPHVLVLTATLSACMMVVVAHRTGKQAFVWAMLASVMLAYNFSPVFFADLGRMLLSQGARLVNEERLPYAFYGLTYLPLLLTAMVVSRTRAAHGDKLFAAPLRTFSTALGCLMLAISVGHPKAMFPVGLGMTFVFTLQAIWFRDGRLALLSILAWIMAALGLPVFVEKVVGLAMPADSEMLAVTLATGLLLLAGGFFDSFLASLMPARLVEALSQPSALIRLRSRFWNCVCQNCSLLLTLGLGGYWLIHQYAIVSDHPGSWLISLVLVLLFATHALRRTDRVLAGMAIVFCHSILLVHALAEQMPVDVLVSLFTLLLLGQWLAGYWLARIPDSRVSRTFLAANHYLSSYALVLGLVAIYFPAFLLQAARPLLDGPHIALLLEIRWPFQLLMVIWAFDAARREANPLLTIFGCFGVIGFVGATLMTVAGAAGWSWLPAAWAGAALAALPAAERLHRRLQGLLQRSTDHEAIERCRALSWPIDLMILGLLGLAAVGSLLAFPLGLRVAGGAGLVGLLMFSVLRRQPAIRIPAMILINWQVISLTVLLVGPPMQFVTELSNTNLVPVCLPVALVAAFSLFLWQTRDRARPSPWRELVNGHFWALRGLLLLALAGSMQHSTLAGIHIVLAATSFFLVIASELITACRKQDERRVWAGEIIALAAVVYFAYFRVVMIGRGTTMFALLIVGFLVWVAGEWARHRPRLSILKRPLQQTALTLPLAAVAVGVYRHCFAQPIWLGANSLALLLAAAFYFWRGLERPSKPFLILSSVILNIALIFLWRELAWTDPQFFLIPIGVSILALVQLLKQEIPQKFHDPLRYLGALVILVSPTFHIVGGSCIHLFSLMLASVSIVLVAIGLRVRALMFTGTAFLIADLVAMVVRGSIDDPNVLWIAGLMLGAAVIALGGYCERHRETLLARMRVLSEALKQWQ